MYKQIHAFQNIKKARVVCRYKNAAWKIVWLSLLAAVPMCYALGYMRVDSELILSEKWLNGDRFSYSILAPLSCIRVMHSASVRDVNVLSIRSGIRMPELTEVRCIGTMGKLEYLPFPISFRPELSRERAL